MNFLMDDFLGKYGSLCLPITVEKFFVKCSYFIETIKEFENLTQLSKFEKQHKGKLKIDNIDYSKETKLWTVTFVDV